MKPEKQLYQWDVNQYLTGINPAAQYVDYTIGNEVIRIKSDGTRCRIPDEVLQTYGGKTCYERYPDGTFRAYSFSVLYAPKPPDYIYTPEEHTTFEALTARVDAAIEEIKRRADSGEFTPKKGVDYFTEAEKNELMEGVSSGAVGEFQKVVDSATTEYDDNHNSKLAEYNANASEKLTTYDTNAEQHTTDYNRNAEVKLEAYNQNHAAKVAEYNQNAETKKAEFDSNAAALQTEVDRLRGECDTLAAENRKQENRIDALIKLNKGQTYDILTEDGESASRTAPSGSKYVSVDKVGGKSVVWNQLWNYGETGKETGVTFTYENHFYDVVKNTTANNGLYVSYKIKSNNKYYVSYEASSNDNIKLTLSLGVTLTAELTESNKRYRNIITTENLTTPRDSIYLYSPSGVNCSYRVGNIKVIDLTQMFGAGNEPTAEQFEQMFPANYYPYSEPTIISSQTDRVDTVGFNQWDEEWAKINVSMRNGNTVPSTNTIGSKNFCPILPSTAYYATCGKTDWGSQNNYYLGLIFYDENKQYISSGYYNNLVFATPEKARFFKITTNTGTVIYGNTYNHDICINLSDPSRNGEYEPYSLQQIPTNFPVLNSAGSVYDYIDLNEGKHHQRVGVKDLGTIDWEQGGTNNRTSWVPVSWKTNVKPVESNDIKPNILCNKYYTDVAGHVEQQLNDKTITVNKTSCVYIYDSAYVSVTPQEFKTAMSGVMLYYELAEEVITDIDIPTELTEWLQVEPGGTVTFRNSDDTKQLQVPNAVSWVRKLDEVN